MPMTARTRFAPHPPSRSSSCWAPDAGRISIDAGDASSPACTDAVDCQDESACNGAELCVEGRCAPGTAPDCDDGIECTVDACDERLGCVHRLPDVDGDGHPDALCGGDDCDDADTTRFPGAAEVCDAAGVDEDCDPRTFGFLDADYDGYASVACCNGDNCGDDCDDTFPIADPSAAEVATASTTTVTASSTKV